MDDQADGAIIVARHGRRGVLEADADNADDQEHEPQAQQMVKGRWSAEVHATNLPG